MLIGAFGPLEAFFQVRELRAGGFDFAGDAGLFGAEFLGFEVEALFFVGELAGAFAAAFELGERAFDFRLHGGDECLGASRFTAGFAQGGFDALAFLTGALVAGFLLGELDFLLGDEAGELFERFVGGDEIKLLFCELLAGGFDVE